MPPIGPLRTDDGPGCRICSCTEYNACLDTVTGFACHWVETSGNDNPRHLCSACSGTEADLVNSINRGVEQLAKCTKLSIDVAVAIGTAAVIRRDKRAKLLGN